MTKTPEDPHHQRRPAWRSRIGVSYGADVSPLLPLAIAAATAKVSRGAYAPRKGLPPPSLTSWAVTAGAGLCGGLATGLDEEGVDVQRPLGLYLAWVHDAGVVRQGLTREGAETTKMPKLLVGDGEHGLTRLGVVLKKSSCLYERHNLAYDAQLAAILVHASPTCCHTTAARPELTRQRHQRRRGQVESLQRGRAVWEVPARASIRRAGLHTADRRTMGKGKR